jgi:hypothetical protein
VTIGRPLLPNDLRIRMRLKASEHRSGAEHWLTSTDATGRQIPKVRSVGRRRRGVDHHDRTFQRRRCDDGQLELQGCELLLATRVVKRKTSFCVDDRQAGSNPKRRPRRIRPRSRLCSVNFRLVRNPPHNRCQGRRSLPTSRPRGTSLCTRLVRRPQCYTCWICSLGELCFV